MAQSQKQKHRAGNSSTLQANERKHGALPIYHPPSTIQNSHRGFSSQREARAKTTHLDPCARSNQSQICHFTPPHPGKPSDSCGTEFPRRGVMLQSTDQFFLFAPLWTTQYTARSTTPSAYKYSTRTCTSCPTHIVLTACPTCLQPVPYQLPSSISCHRLLQAPPRLCPATAASGKLTLLTSAAFP